MLPFSDSNQRLHLNAAEIYHYFLHSCYIKNSMKSPRSNKKIPNIPTYKSYDYPLSKQASSPLSEKYFQYYGDQNRLRHSPSFKTKPHTPYISDTKTLKKGTQINQYGLNSELYCINEKDSQIETTTVGTPVEQKLFRYYCDKKWINNEEIHTSSQMGGQVRYISVLQKQLQKSKQKMREMDEKISKMITLNSNIERQLQMYRRKGIEEKDKVINLKAMNGKSDMENMLSPWKLNQYLSQNDKNISKKEEINIETEIELFTEKQLNRMLERGSNKNQEPKSSNSLANINSQTSIVGRQQQMAQLLKRAIEQIRARDQKIEFLENELSLKQVHEQKLGDKSHNIKLIFEGEIKKMRKLVNESNENQRALQDKILKLDAELREARHTIEKLNFDSKVLSEKMKSHQHLLQLKEEQINRIIKHQHHQSIKQISQSDSRATDTPRFKQRRAE